MIFKPLKLAGMSEGVGQNYCWPCMSEAVHEHAIAWRACHCSMATAQHKPEVQPLPVPVVPLQHITLDWLSGFPGTVDAYDCLLNSIYHCSKCAVTTQYNE